MDSHFTNVNYFASDTERPLEKRFSGRRDALARACQAAGGTRRNMDMPYDLAAVFTALPRLSLLLLFNDADEEFPARGTVLFQKHGERYLDPESLAMTSAFLVRRLGRVGE